jgi:hypothetical protein
MLNILLYKRFILYNFKHTLKKDLNIKTYNFLFVISFFSFKK